MVFDVDVQLVWVFHCCWSSGISTTSQPSLGFYREWSQRVTKNRSSEALFEVAKLKHLLWSNLTLVIILHDFICQAIQDDSLTAWQSWTAAICTGGPFHRVPLHNPGKQPPPSGGGASKWSQQKAAIFHLYAGGHNTGRSYTSRDPALIWSCSHHLPCVDQPVLNTEPHLSATLVAVTFFHFEISTRSNLPLFPFSFCTLSFLALPLYFYLSLLL